MMYTTFWLTLSNSGYLKPIVCNKLKLILRERDKTPWQTDVWMIRLFRTVYPVRLSLS